MGLYLLVWTSFMGAKQFGFGDYEQSTAKMHTKRELFMARCKR
jgi:hypothetical protein